MQVTVSSQGEAFYYDIKFLSPPISLMMLCVSEVGKITFKRISLEELWDLP